MISILHLENSFTSTIASVASLSESHEKLVPGGIYILMTAMAGSIVSHNQNILLRVSVPLTVKVRVSWLMLPVMMQNVADLLWHYELRVLIVAENHLRVQGTAVKG